MTPLEAFVTTFALDASGFLKGEKEVRESTRKIRDDTKKTFDEMEQRGKSAAQAFRQVRNETAGMFLAFMGASSMMGFLGNMFQGVVASTRLGEAIGVASEKVRAWRQAVREVGGQPGSADAALQKIAGDQQDWRLTGRTSSDANYRRFGITPGDLVNKDASDILLKISAAADKMSKPEAARRLQMMGLSQDVINLILQGHDAVKKAIDAGEKNAKATKDQEQAALDLQKQIAELQNEIANALVPALLDLVPYIRDGVRYLKDLLGYLGVTPSVDATQALAPKGGGITNRFIGGGGAQAPVGPSGNASVNERLVYSFLKDKGLPESKVRGIMAGLYAENTSFNPNVRGGYKGRAVGIGQWLGDRRAELFRRYGEHPTLQQQLEFLWWELRGGDKGGVHVMAQPSSSGAATAMIRKFFRPAPGMETNQDLQRAQQYLRSRGAGNVTIGQITIHTKATDAKGIALAMRPAIRNSIGQANSGLRS